MTGESFVSMVLIMLALIGVAIIGPHLTAPYHDPDPFQPPVILNAAQSKSRQAKENAAFERWWSTVLEEERAAR